MSTSEDLHRALVSLGACEEAIKWSNGLSLDRAWATCNRGDWMIWLLTRKCVERDKARMLGFLREIAGPDCNESDADDAVRTRFLSSKAAWNEADASLGEPWRQQLGERWISAVMAAQSSIADSVRKHFPEPPVLNLENK